MAESGIRSAFGMAIENKFRKVPLTGDQVGIANTNPLRFWTVEPDGGFMARPDIVVPHDEIDGDIGLKRTILAAKDYDGGETWKADAENLVLALLGLFGQTKETQIAGTTTTTITDVYKQVFTKAGKLPSFTVEEIFGEHAYGRLSSGVIINRLDMTFGRVMMARMGAVPYRQIPNRYILPSTGADVDYDWTNADGDLPAQMQDGTEGVQAKITATPTYIDVDPTDCGDGPFVHARIINGSKAGFESNFLTLNDDPLTYSIEEGFTINCFRDTESHHIAGSGYDPGDTTANAFHCEGRFDVLYRDNVILKNTLAKCRFGLNFKIVGIPIGNSGQSYSIEFHVPRFRFLESQTNKSARAMRTGGGWVAEVDPVLGYEVEITLISTTSVADWGGKVGDSPGGLGGWNLVA
jgi:hypothetical protein